MERRLAAILAADVVAYCRLMEQDEAATLAALRDRRKTILTPLVALHKGRIIKFMGDGVLVEFTSAVNAVQCAVELQQKMAEANVALDEDRAVVLRIGINLGDVVVEGEDLFGDGVNIAARLEAIAEPGTVCLSGTVFDQAKGKLKLDYQDLGPQLLKNIREPVQAYLVRSNAADDESRSRPAAPALPAKPSMAVLPFDNLSGSPEQQYFSDGISEDLITELSRFRSLFVIARNSSFQYRGKAVDIKRVGRELGVRYVLEGSVQRSGGRVRVTAQLVDALSGNHLWAERYDRDLQDIFIVQDEVVQTIVSTLVPRLESEEFELAKRRAPQNLRAYDLWLHGNRSANLWTAEGNAAARRYFDEAKQLDPAFGRAYAGLAAAIHWLSNYPGWSSEGANLEQAIEYAHKAIDLDETDHLPHLTLAWIHQQRREFDISRLHLDRASLLNPNDAEALVHRGLVLTLQGEADAGLASAEAAIRRNPHHPNWYLGVLATIHFVKRNYVQSIRLREMTRTFSPEHLSFFAAGCAYAGDLKRAEELMQQFSRLPKILAGGSQRSHACTRVVVQAEGRRRSHA